MEHARVLFADILLQRVRIQRIRRHRLDQRHRRLIAVHRRRSRVHDAPDFPDRAPRSARSASRPRWSCASRPASRSKGESAAAPRRGTPYQHRRRHRRSTTRRGYRLRPARPRDSHTRACRHAKLSITRTRCPAARSASTRCDPIKPAPPVTSRRRPDRCDSDSVLMLTSVCEVARRRIPQNCVVCIARIT